MKHLTVAVAAVAILALTAAASAQPGRPAAKAWDIRAGAGVMIRPTFDGSDRYRARPLPFVTANWRDTIIFGESGLTAQLRRTNYRIGVGLTFDGGREEQDTGGIFASGDDRLKGMGDIDFALGVRAIAGWQVGPVEVNGSVTKFTGARNDGLVARVGLSLPVPLSRTLILIPNVSTGWADERTNQTFFGVTASQDSRSIFPAFNARAGFQDVRAGLNIAWNFHRNWFAAANIAALQLLGDSAESPISLADTSVTGFALIGYRF